MNDDIQLTPFPEIDVSLCIPYESIRYVPGFANSTIKRIAEEYARQAILGDRARRADAHPAPVDAPSEADLAGLLFDFGGFLSSHETRWKFSAYDDASPMVQAIEEFAAKRALPLEPCNVSNWRRAALAGSAPAEPTAEPKDWAAEAMKWRRKYAELRYPGLTREMHALNSQPTAQPAPASGLTDALAAQPINIPLVKALTRLSAALGLAPGEPVAAIGDETIEAALVRMAVERLAAKGGLTDAAYDQMRHVANEWADMASNGLQWIRNIAEGISTPVEALENMTTNLAHCREVNDALAASRTTPTPGGDQ